MASVNNFPPEPRPVGLLVKERIYVLGQDAQHPFDSLHHQVHISLCHPPGLPLGSYPVDLNEVSHGVYLLTMSFLVEKEKNSTKDPSGYLESNQIQAFSLLNH